MTASSNHAHKHTRARKTHDTHSKHARTQTHTTHTESLTRNLEGERLFSTAMTRPQCCPPLLGVPCHARPHAEEALWHPALPAVAKSLTRHSLHLVCPLRNWPPVLPQVWSGRSHAHMGVQHRSHVKLVDMPQCPQSRGGGARGGALNGGLGASALSPAGGRGTGHALLLEAAGLVCTSGSNNFGGGRSRQASAASLFSAAW